MAGKMHGFFVRASIQNTGLAPQGRCQTTPSLGMNSTAIVDMPDRFGCKLKRESTARPGKDNRTHVGTTVVILLFLCLFPCPWSSGARPPIPVTSRHPNWWGSMRMPRPLSLTPIALPCAD